MRELTLPEIDAAKVAGGSDNAFVTQGSGSGGSMGWHDVPVYTGPDAPSSSNPFNTVTTVTSYGPAADGETGADLGGSSGSYVGSYSSYSGALAFNGVAFSQADYNAGSADTSVVDHTYIDSSVGVGIIATATQCGGETYVGVGVSASVAPVDIGAGFVSDCDGTFAGLGLATGVGLQGAAGFGGAGGGINSDIGTDLTYGVNVTPVVDAAANVAGSIESPIDVSPPDVDTIDDPDGDASIIDFLSPAGDPDHENWWENQ